MYHLFDWINNLFDWGWHSSGLVGNYLMIVLWSLVSAILFLLVFKKMTRQEKIVLHKKKIMGFIFQLRIYQDRLTTLFSSIFHILKHNILYVRYTLSSLLVVIVPFMIIFGQINIRGGYAPMETAQAFNIMVHLDDAFFDRETINNPGVFSIETSGGVSIETPPLRIREENAVYWRTVLTRDAGSSEYIQLNFQGRRIILPIKTVLDNAGFSPYLSKPTLDYAIMYNAAGFIEKDSPVKWVKIDYHRLSYPFLFLNLDALVLYLLLTMIFALLFKPFFKVTI